jgi:uncharacterized protein (DUF1778 family)
MTTKVNKKEKARFDTRLSTDQKQFFERAAIIGGYRSLTDFIILTVQEKAKRIVKEREQVLASQKDSEVFFDALMNVEKPNKDLTDALKQYKNLVSE